MILKLIYTLFLGLLVALFVGLGIDAFYPGPDAPYYPPELEYSKPDCQEDSQTAAMRINLAEDQKEFVEKSKPYNRDVSIIALIFAILILIASLTLFSKIKIIADGILLGGVFTTAYSIIRVLMSEDSRFRFLIVTIGLAIAVILGYLKFVRPQEKE